MTKWLNAGLRRFFCLLACGMALSVHAQVATQEGLVQLDIGRGDARLPVYVMPHPQATATLILLPGGDAGTGKMVGGSLKAATFCRARGVNFSMPISMSWWRTARAI